MLLEALDLRFDKLGHAVFDEINLVNRDFNILGYFGGGPLMVHQEIEYSIFFRVYRSFHFVDGGVEQSPFPLLIPNDLKVFGLFIDDFVKASGTIDSKMMR